MQDEHGRVSAWGLHRQNGRWVCSHKATGWQVGLARDQVFTRKPGSPPDNTMPDPWLRKSFTLAAVPRRALIYVASVGYHELFVNGQRVGDAVLMPCVTDLTKRARYVTYDITRNLQPGANVIGLWLGTSWSIFPPFHTRTNQPARSSSPRRIWNMLMAPNCKLSRMKPGDGIQVQTRLSAFGIS